MSLLKIQCIGNCGKDAVVKQINGKNVLNFSIAHTEKFKKDGVDTEKTTWLDCSMWGDNPFKVAQYIKKGKQIYIEGQPESRLYQKNDGSWGSSLAVRVFELKLLGGKDSQPNGQQQPQEQTAATGDITEPIDDLPF